MVKASFFNFIYKFSHREDYSAFYDALKRPERTQEKILFSILKKNQDTVFGKKYGFRDIRSIEQFKNRVPISVYTDYENFLQNISRDRDQVLTRDTVLVFEKTLTGNLIPYTKELFNSFRRATSISIVDLMSEYPEIKTGHHYWQLSLKFEDKNILYGDIPVDNSHDFDQHVFVDKRLVKEFLVTPRAFLIGDLNDYFIKTSVALIDTEDLTFMSISSPIFVQMITNFIEKNLNIIKLRINNSSLLRFNSFIDAKFDYRVLWPQLGLISCWGDAASRIYLYLIKEKFPWANIHQKGLLMKEGVVSIQIANFDYPILAINSHFFEFMDSEGKILNFDHLKRKEHYVHLITTDGGLYRYNTNEVVEVVEFKNKVPLLRYVGKKSMIDIAGEQLDEWYIYDALLEVNAHFDLKPKFQMLAPAFDGGKKRYVLFLEAEISHLNPQVIGRSLEEIFNRKHSYNMTRIIEQIDAVEILMVSDGIKRYHTKILEKGIHNFSELYPQVVSCHDFWYEYFH